MTSRSITLTEALEDYAQRHSTRPDYAAEELIGATRAVGPLSGMQISPAEGAFLTILAGSVGARLAVEVGTFTGFSSMCIARGLAAGGRLITCEINDRWADPARTAWQRAGVADRIELVLAPARQTLASLPEDPQIDFAFIDADKPGYVDYYEAILPRMRTGGLIVADNTLFCGLVVDPSTEDANALAIRRFNEHVAADNRVEVAVLTAEDGISLIWKKPGDGEIR